MIFDQTIYQIADVAMLTILLAIKEIAYADVILRGLTDAFHPVFQKIKEFLKGRGYVLP